MGELILVRVDVGRQVVEDVQRADRAVGMGPQADGGRDGEVEALWVEGGGEGRGHGGAEPGRLRRDSDALRRGSRCTCDRPTYRPPPVPSPVSSLPTPTMSSADTPDVVLPPLTHRELAAVDGVLKDMSENARSEPSISITAAPGIDTPAHDVGTPPVMFAAGGTM